MTSRYDEIATPCPSRRSRGSSESFDKFSILSEDDTAAIDFTTELSLPSFAREKPVRRAASFKIHEDRKYGIGKAEGVEVSKPAAGKSTTRPSLLAQPPQRFPRARGSFVSAVISGSTNTNMKSGVGRELTSTGERCLVESRPIGKLKEEGWNKPSKPDRLKKDRRREVIYIPPDDTVVPSIFMGIFSPVKNEAPSSLNGRNCQDRNPMPLKRRSSQTNPVLRRHTTEPTQKKEASLLGERMSSMSNDIRTRKGLAPPTSSQRAPLQPSLKPLQEKYVHRDVAGRRTGKENIPPGEVLASKLDSEELNDGIPLPQRPCMSQKQDITASSRLLKPAAPRPALKQQTDSPKPPTPTIQSCAARNRLQLPNLPKENRTILKTQVNVPQPDRHTNEDARGVSENAESFNSSNSSSLKKTPSKKSIHTLGTLNIGQRYPAISNDVLNPSMYEERWLEHQEVALTELANRLFDASRAAKAIEGGDLIRSELLGHYQSPYCALLYKRIQESLLHGTLHVPQIVLRRSNRLKDDVGFRRKILDLWLDTYHLSALQAAAETVVGRQISQASCESILRDKRPVKEDRARQQAVQRFLKTYLLENEDADPPSVGRKSDFNGMEGWRYRRTLLRSFMMITLLDKARTSPGTSLPRNLFLSTSRYKSSAAVLQALASVMFPTAGDVVRQLTHLGCQLKYQQHPLHEYNYRINNLAVDLRDGIILTRMVELLLLCSDHINPEVMASMISPTGGIPSPLNEEECWPLSQHLKVPCVSRGTKLFNVQVALSALSKAKGISEIVKDICPADIVDGYREKTIALLWVLVGKWGLSALIDWADVKREIARLERKYKSQNGLQQDELTEIPSETIESPNDECALQQCLLRKWASRLAMLKGLEVNDLTTSFSDGRIFESIVDEYEGFIGELSNPEQFQSDRPSFEARLCSLGCSAQFARLLTPGPAKRHVFDQDFTLGALAFLCSRLLSASKHARAAITIQSAWRKRHASHAR